LEADIEANLVDRSLVVFGRTVGRREDAIEPMGWMFILKADETFPESKLMTPKK
jgi:hypothetical protein